MPCRHWLEVGQIYKSFRLQFVWPKSQLANRSVSPTNHLAYGSVRSEVISPTGFFFAYKSSRPRGGSPSSHFAYRSVSPSSHLGYRSVSPPGHLGYRSVSPTSHLGYRSVSPTVHIRYKSVSPTSQFTLKSTSNRSVSPTTNFANGSVRPRPFS